MKTKYPSIATIITQKRKIIIIPGSTLKNKRKD
jgi:hypothetical protein